ncbi:hypothetical protein [Mangrovibacterium marinum]|uniref:HYR-like domain-containing protein n=1 Tax=Mangrovibacterium marinum TaxID=1639118 RepID=UPI002A18D886|nr:hypothetical protein [Mangrovibacterium marinum]
MKKLYFLRNDLTQESNDKSLPTCHVRSILLVLIFLFTGSSFLWAQTVTTDKADYLPGETVTISGTNWLPGETVLLVLEKEPPVTDPVVLSAVADENGDISNSEYVVLQEDLGVTFTLTATGQSSLLTATTTFTDGGGAYTINLAAADPSNYIPAIPYPTDLTAPTGYGDGNAVIPLALFNDGSSDVKVESLAPEDMALGQIVPFEIKITVSGDITPENGIITFVVGWNTLTTNGGDFGYDARGDDVGYGVFRAFIDTGDGAYTDGSIQATVDTYTWSLINDEIIGIFTVSGLEYGDEVVVEAWLVLDDDIPAGIGGNVQSRLIVAATGPDQTINVSNSGTITLVNGDAISTGNQTVPLLKPSDFFNADVDLSVTKTDDIDPILVGETLTYEITASNAGPSVANSVVVYDVLDPNVTFVSASDGGYINTDSGDLIPDGAVQWNVGALAPGASVTYTVSVAVNNDSPATGTGGDGSSTSCITGVDLCNHVAFITISDDTNSSNDQYYEPTGVYNCPDFTLPANGESTVSCLSDATQPTPPTVNDHLGSPIVPSGPTIVDTPDPLVCSGTRVYTWTYEDCEYSHEWTYTYTVNDNLAPMFTTTPAQLELTCFDQDAIDTWLASAAASDNCGGLVTIDNDYSAPTGDCLNGTYPVKFTATDVCNNSAEVTVNIVINDDVAPVFTTTPAQLELTCFDQDAIDTWLASAAASDNCGGLVTIDNDYSAPTGDCLNGTYPVKFTATDVCNNSAEVTVNIVINDDVAPVFTTTPAQLELTCFDQDAIDTWLASAAASDNCGGLVTIDNNYSAPTGDCLNGTYPVKFTTTDVCNNSAEVTVNIVINDDVAPVFTTTPAQLELTCFDQDAIDTWLASAAASDNCGGLVTIDNNYSAPTGDCLNGTYPVKFTATDVCNNSAEVTVNIVINDDVAPVFTTTPAQLELTCFDQDAIDTWLASAAASDNCGGLVTIDNNYSAPTGDCLNGTYPVKFTATDVCNNSAEVTVNIVINDDVAPVFTTTPAQLELTCFDQDAIDTWLASAAASDNCGGLVTIDNNYSAPTGDCLNGTYPVKFTTTDVCNNSAEVTVNIVINDDVAPMFTTTPAQLELTCFDQDAIDTWLASAAASDNCGELVTIDNNYSAPTGDCLNGTYPVKFTATDVCNNSAEVTVNIVINDDVAPEFTTTPAQLELTCFDQDAIDTWLASAAASDNCGGLVTIDNNYSAPTGDCLNGTYPVKFTATDVCNNSAEVTVNIVINDDVAPVFTTTPAQLELTCFDQDAIDTWLASAAASDNCGGLVTIDNNYSAPTGDCLNGTYPVKFTATDVCNNSAEVTVNIVINDDVAPVFTTTPAQLELTCFDQDAIDTWLASAAASDNCGGLVTIDNDYSAPTGDCLNGTYPVKFTATDVCNNSAEVTVNIVINDDVAPVFTTTPAQLELTCFDQDAIDTWLASAAASDNCGGLVTIDNNYSAPTGDCLNGTYPVKFTATDVCNNSAEVTVNIVINDDVAPVFTTTPAQLELTCFDQDAIDTWLASAAASDNCGGLVTIDNNYSAPTGDCLNGTYPVKFTATDVCNNSAEVTVNIVINDDVAPVFTTTPAQLELTCFDQDAIDTWLASAAASDNCGGLVTIDNNYSAPTGDCLNGTYPVKFTATDVCNNSAEVTVNIVINDDVAPVFTTTPAQLELTCFDQDAIDTWLASAAASDNCGGLVTIDNNYSAPTGDCLNGTYPVKFTATDVCNNSAEVTVNIVINDDVAPEFTTTPAQLELTCFDQDAIDTWLASAAASDNCGGLVTIDNDYSAPTGDCLNGTYPVKFTATDVCNNSAEVTVNIVINDDVAPVFTTTPAQLELTCFDQDAIDTWLASAAASDNCGGLVTIDNNYSAPTGDCLNGTYPVKFTATDVCNNSAEVTVNIVINDDVAPEFTTTPAQLELTCFDQDAIDTWLASAAASDNCGGLVTIDNNYSAPTGDCLNGTYPVKFTTTDVCNNSAEVTVNIVINDDVAPVFTTTPAQLELTCFDQDAIDTWLASAAASDNCGGLVTIDNDYSAPTGDCLNGTYPVKFTATDVCNNSAEVTVNIVINDDVAPVFTTTPAQLELTCFDQDAIDTWLASAAASDNCGGLVTIDNNYSAPTGDCLNGTYPVKFTATDVCNNSAEVTVNIVINDDVAPVFTTTPAQLELTCFDQDAIDTWLASAAASDNCGGLVTIDNNYSAPTGDCLNGTYPVKFTATDVCNNSAEVTVNIVINDDVAPVFTTTPAQLELTCFDQDAIDTWLASAAASDNCGGLVTIDNNYSAPTGDCLNGTYPVKFTTTDVCNNSAEVTVNIVINDDVAPVFTTTPAQLELTCFDQDAIDTWLASAAASDNCGGLVTIDNNYSAPTGDCLNGTYPVKFTTTDVCNNSAEVTVNIVINDDVAPVFTTTPAQLELTCFDQDAIDTWLASAAASDNCGGLVTIDNDYSAPTGDCLNGTYPVKFTATDVCNNSAEVTVNIVINDDVAPVFTTTPAQLELTCFDQDAIDTWLASAAASDNCGGLVTIDNNYSAPTGDCLNGTYPVKFTTTDVCNNSAEVTVNIVINDDVAPVFTTTPAQLELTCFDQDAIDTWLASAAASDNCGGLVTIDNDYSAPTGDCLNGTYPVKFTATDVCNNSAEVTVNIVINDNTPPVITCPPLAVVNCEGDTSPENTGKATATDNCDASVDITYLDATSTTPGCAATATITRTWTATDDCDNSSSCDQTILVASIDIVKTFAADNVIAGGAGSSFTLHVTNDGSAPLSNVAIYDDVDDRLTVTSISGTAGTDADTDGDAQTVEWLIPLLAPGASETITVTFQVASDVEEADGVEGRLNDEYNVPNSATVNAIATDDNTISVGDEDDDTIDIKVVIDLSIVKEFVPAEVQVPQGTFQTFTLVVSNAGPSDAVDVLVKDTVHSSLEITGVNVLDPGIGTATWDGPYLDCTVQIPAGESVTIEVEYLTAPFLDGDSPNDTGAGDDFYFVFVNGSVLEGSTDGGPVLLDGVDITDQVQIITSLTRNDLIIDPDGPDGPDPAFEMHLSCSDPFTDGWGQSAGPVEGVDVNWQIAFFTIARFNANGYIKSCGNVTVPYDIPNTGYASGEDSYETQEVDDDANVTIIPGITLTDLTTLGKRLTARLTNKTGDDKVIEEVTVVWPESNGDLVKVWLVTGNVTEVIWEGNAASLDTTLNSGSTGWYGSTLLTGEAILRFDFVNKVADSGYTIQVSFTDNTWLDIHKVGDQPTTPDEEVQLICPSKTRVACADVENAWLAWVNSAYYTGEGDYYIETDPAVVPECGTTTTVTFNLYDESDNWVTSCTSDFTVKAEKSAEIESPALEAIDLQVYPNPFSEKVRFEFVSPEAAQVRIDLYDMHGRMIKTVFDEMIEGNALKVAEFVPQGKASGAYHYRCIIGDEIFTGTLIYQK